MIKLQKRQFFKLFASPSPKPSISNDGISTHNQNFNKELSHFRALYLSVTLPNT